MPPQGTAKKRGRPTAKPPNQTASGVKESRVSLFGSGNRHGFAPARDAVLQTPELLEHILSFTGFKTVLLSAVRVNKHFNATITASPRLQGSFTPVPAELSDPSKHFLINDALLKNTFQFPGTDVLWYFGRCCWSSSRVQRCKGDHFLKILLEFHKIEKRDISATSWRKLRVLLPLDNSKTCRVRFYGGVCEEFPAIVTLGELYDFYRIGPAGI